MWDPQHLTNLQACYRESFTFFLLYFMVDCLPKFRKNCRIWGSHSSSYGCSHLLRGTEERITSIFRVWFLARLIFDPGDGGDRLLRNFCSHADYTALYPRRWQHSFRRNCLSPVPDQILATSPCNGCWISTGTDFRRSSLRNACTSFTKWTQMRRSRPSTWQISTELDIEISDQKLAN
jgi:hypothetical protein